MLKHSVIKVDDNLWLGNVGARNKDILQELGIEVIISVMTPDERDTLVSALDESIMEYDIGLDDTPHSNLQGALRKLFGNS